MTWPRWREVAAQKLWPVPEAVVTVLCTSDDGCVWHPNHVEWTSRIINRLLCVASGWTIISIFSKNFWHYSSVHIPCPFGPNQFTQAAHRSPLHFATLTTPTDLTKWLTLSLCEWIANRILWCHRRRFETLITVRDSDLRNGQCKVSERQERGRRVSRCAGTPQALVFYMKQRVWARSCALTKLIML